MAPIARGGLNIIDFETKCSSLRLWSLSGYREGFGTCKWHFLAGYFFENRFSNLDPSFDFLLAQLLCLPSRLLFIVTVYLCYLPYVVSTALCRLIFLVRICIVFF